jgi:outer membrane phospholipase A
VDVASLSHCSEKVAPPGQLSEPKFKLQLSNRDKREITNYKHHLILKLGQINLKFQYPMTKTLNAVVPYRCPNFSPLVIMSFGTNAGRSSVWNFEF